MLLWLLGCTPLPDCETGVWPYDGATHRPLTQRVVFRLDQNLEEPLPAINEEVARLVELESQEPVPVRMAHDRRTLALVPLEPLKADSDYEVWGVELEGFASPNYLNQASEDGPQTVRFSTGGQPDLLEGAFDDEGLLLLFSEAVDLDSLVEDSLVRTSDGRSQPFVGIWEGRDYVLRFRTEREDRDLALRLPLSALGTPFACAVCTPRVDERYPEHQDLLGLRLMEAEPEDSGLEELSPTQAWTGRGLCTLR